MDSSVCESETDPALTVSQILPEQQNGTEDSMRLNLEQISINEHQAETFLQKIESLKGPL